MAASSSFHTWSKRNNINNRRLQFLKFIPIFSCWLQDVDLLVFPVPLCSSVHYVCQELLVCPLHLVLYILLYMLVSKIENGTIKRVQNDMSKNYYLILAHCMISAESAVCWVRAWTFSGQSNQIEPEKEKDCPHSAFLRCFLRSSCQVEYLRLTDTNLLFSSERRDFFLKSEKRREISSKIT